MTKDYVIPKWMIDRAEKLGACKPALRWLRHKKRTIEEFIAHDWAKETWWQNWFVLMLGRPSDFFAWGCFPANSPKGDTIVRKVFLRLLRTHRNQARRRKP